MIEELHRALIGIRVFSSEGSLLMQKIVVELRTEAEVLSSSSIYRVSGEINDPDHVHELKRVEKFDGLAAVILVSTTQEPMALLNFLRAIEMKYRSEVLRRSVSLNLLAFDDEAVMTPELTLPHPELHRRPEFVLLSAEVWGDYFHPVLKENLYTLTRKFHDEQWGRFYAQGKTLLDF
jgi:2-amino-4-hydroxy-6-hydroxymethyldihydropteridine diphosphokinase